MTLNITRVGTKALPKLWKVVGDFIENSIQQGAYRQSLESIHQEILEGYQQLWIVHTHDNGIYACCVTKICEGEPANILHIEHIAGAEAVIWRDDMLQVLETFALENNCKWIEACGRKGWKKYNKQYGFEEVHTLFRKNLNDIVRH